MTVREIVLGALGWWEPRRILYNLTLTVVVVAHFISGYPHSREVLTVNTGVLIFILAVLANVAYCAAYLTDIFVQMTNQHSILIRARWAIFAVGTAFAAALTHLFSKGIFLDV
jgi:hypothetical protein